jgi:hypothetical protein
MARNGIVSMFDILGYRALIRAKPLDYVFRLVKDVLCRIPEYTGNHLRRDFEQAGTPGLAVFLQNFQSLVVSDTILGFYSLPPGLPPAVRGNYWAFALFHSAVLQKLTFAFGIPVRGAIACGDYFVVDNSFAGRPMIDAYDLSSAIQLSACVLTDTARLEIEQLGNVGGIRRLLDPFLFSYETPLRGGTSATMMHVDWFGPFRDHPEDPAELDAATRKAFEAHGKEVTPSVEPKVQNTVSLMRWINDQRI